MCSCGWKGKKQAALLRQALRRLVLPWIERGTSSPPGAVVGDKWCGRGWKGKDRQCRQSLLVVGRRVKAGTMRRAITQSSLWIVELCTTSALAEEARQLSGVG